MFTCSSLRNYIINNLIQLSQQLRDKNAYAVKKYFTMIKEEENTVLTHI